MKQAIALYVVRKVRNQEYYTVKSKDCPVSLILTDKEQAKRICQKLNSTEGEERNILEKNTY